MNTNFNNLLKAAKENGHDLNTLIKLTETFPSLLNPELEIKEVPELGFNALEDFPNVKLFISWEDEAIHAAKIRNGEINESGVSGKQL